MRRPLAPTALLSPWFLVAALLVLPALGEAQGTLRQEEISLTLRTGSLLIRVTPLTPWVVETAAPDTRNRLEAMEREYGPELVDRWGAGTLFLVTLFSNAPDAPFEAHDLTLESRGFIQRSVAISPVTPGWSSGRVGQQETAMAVYLFPEAVDPTELWDVRYGSAGTRGEWARMLPRIQAERNRLF
ncbi:MAG: hypothetical protein WEA09_15180 [Gemmatimonadota bacterium]